MTHPDLSTGANGARAKNKALPFAVFPDSLTHTCVQPLNGVLSL